MHIVVTCTLLQMLYLYVNSSKKKWEVTLIDCKLQYVMSIIAKIGVVIKAQAIIP